MSAGGPGALVIGSDYRSLGVVRSLGRHGVPVWVLRGDHELAQWSRFCARSLPWSKGGEAARVAYLLEIAETHRLVGWTLFPTEDETAALIARHRDALAGPYRLSILADWDTLRVAYDKRRTHELAARLGIAHPATSDAPTRDDVAAYNGPFPAIVKPAVSGLTSAKAWAAADRAALLTSYDEASAVVDPRILMIQERIPGDGRQQLSYAALCHEGEPIASIVARRTRQWPMDFGRASTYVESVALPDVEEVATRFLRALRFSGLVEIELKRDARDGRLVLLDVNPRVWGWHTLGRRAGVDFPQLLWRMLEGEDLPRVRGAVGVRWVRALTDVPTALGEMRAGRTSVRAYLGSLRGPIELAVLAPDDPLPAIVELPGTAVLAWRRRRGERRTTQPSPPREVEVA